PREFVEAACSKGGYLDVYSDVDLAATAKSSAVETANIVATAVAQLQLGGMQRKFGAYALGQLGFSGAADLLQAMRQDPAGGVREAASAAFAAVASAPRERGHPEIARRWVIDFVYDPGGRQYPVFT
ncbi:MAG: hypothetical protein KC492_20225, partial [Myxococcales bacterium]|nr:hypothetical protein [Myxococcales bacterium]